MSGVNVYRRHQMMGIVPKDNLPDLSCSHFQFPLVSSVYLPSVTEMHVQLNSGHWFVQSRSLHFLVTEKLHTCFGGMLQAIGPHSLTVLNQKFLLKTHLHSLHVDSDIHQFFLGKNRIYAHSSTKVNHESDVDFFLRTNLGIYWWMRPVVLF